MPPKVIFDYSRCTGTGECVEICPVEILELSENEKWCKAVDEEVENEEAVKKFHEEVENEEAVDITIEYEMSGCVECMACETACPEEAITTEEE